MAVAKHRRLVVVVLCVEEYDRLRAQLSTSTGSQAKIAGRLGKNAADHLNKSEQFGFFRTFGEADGEIFAACHRRFLKVVS